MGKPKIPAARVGQSAAEEFLESANRRVPIDRHAQDQVILFMALAEGVSRVLVGPLSPHTETAIHITSLLTKVSISLLTGANDRRSFSAVQSWAEDFSQSHIISL